jgi:hypothetical protein
MVIGFTSDTFTVRGYNVLMFIYITTFEALVIQNCLSQCTGKMRHFKELILNWGERGFLFQNLTVFSKKS